MGIARSTPFATLARIYETSYPFRCGRRARHRLPTHWRVRRVFHVKLSECTPTRAIFRVVYRGAAEDRWTHADFFVCYRTEPRDCAARTAHIYSTLPAAMLLVRLLIPARKGRYRNGKAGFAPNCQFPRLSLFSRGSNTESLTLRRPGFSSIYVSNPNLFLEFSSTGIIYASHRLCA